MTTNCLELLKLTSSDALEIIIEDNLSGALSIDDLIIDTPVPVQNNNMSVLINSTPNIQNNTQYAGAVLFQYHRLNYNDFFGNLNISLQLELPTTTTIVMQELGRIFNIVFESNDYNDYLIPNPSVEIQPVNCLIKAKTSSQRWYGEVTIKVYKKF